MEVFRCIWVSANQAEDDDELSTILDGVIHYAMAFVNPKGVEMVMNSRRGGTAEGFTYVNKDAEDKKKRAIAGEVFTPKHDSTIAERVARRRRGKSATVVEKKTLEVDV